MIFIACCITIIPLIIIGVIAKVYFRKTYFEICGLLSGACTGPTSTSIFPSNGKKRSAFSNILQHIV
ncbi:MAG: hypothetical protein ACRCR9_07045 [Chitinophagaceae bacterium]